MFQKMQLVEFIKLLCQTGHIKEAMAINQVYRKYMGIESSNEDFESLSMECISNVDWGAIEHQGKDEETNEIERQFVKGNNYLHAVMDGSRSKGLRPPTIESPDLSIVEIIDHIELRLMGIKP